MASGMKHFLYHKDGCIFYVAVLFRTAKYARRSALSRCEPCHDTALHLDTRLNAIPPKKRMDSSSQ